MYEDKEELILSEGLDTPFDTKKEIIAKFLYRMNRQFQCQECLKHHSFKLCPNFSKCPYAIAWLKEHSANTIINKFEDFTEICFYKSSFLINRDAVSNDIDRTRKWIKDETGVLTPKNDSIKIESLTNCLTNSRKRALDNLFGYVLCNTWSYFVTITFKHGKHKKLSDDVVKYQWQKFRQQLQYKYPDIKILLVPEDTPTGNHGMHFHGFIGNADLGEYLSPARNNDKSSKFFGEFLYTPQGDPIFNFMKTLTNIGFTTVVKLKDNNRLKLVNYMTKYMHKDSSNFDYNENSYLHTYNLNFKDKEVANFSDKEKSDLVNTLFAIPYKETEKMIIYRVFNKKESS